MGRPRKSEDKKLNYRLPDIRVTREELSEIESAAESLNMTKTTYLRLLIFKRLPKYKLKPVEIIPDGVKAELCRLGGNLRDLYNRYDPEGIFDAAASSRILKLIEEQLWKINMINDHYIKNVVLGDADDDRQGHQAG